MNVKSHVYLKLVQYCMLTILKINKKNKKNYNFFPWGTQNLGQEKKKKEQWQQKILENVLPSSSVYRWGN